MALEVWSWVQKVQSDVKTEMLRIASVLAVLALVAVCAVAQPTADRVTGLPNLDGKLISMYSGYINIPNTQKYYHYIFVPSQRAPSTDPVILWLNGGPGCSSLDGFFYEHGPYMFGPGAENITLVVNPYSWTRFASVIYLESPVGVGYTYSNNDMDYFVNDATAASDNLNFLVEFFKKAPAYANLPFYVMGESYAGVYVPTLAVAILDSNQAGVNPKINLVGTGSGNPVTNTQSDSTLNAWVPFTFGHGLISPNMYQSIMTSCTNDPDGFSCQSLINQANQVGYNNINPYWVYGTCYSQSFLGRSEASLKALFPPNDPINRAALFKAHQQVPCIDSMNAQLYLNRAVATRAFHVAGNIQWTICSNTLTYTPSGTSMLPNYQKLLQNNIRVIVFSGDADSVVPYTGTSKWVTQEMNLGTPVDDWVPWNYNDLDNGPQVGGWKTTYNVGHGFTYTTIRGSAHMIMDTPGRAYHAISRWIAGQPL